MDYIILAGSEPSAPNEGDMICTSNGKEFTVTKVTKFPDGGWSIACRKLRWYDYVLRWIKKIINKLWLTL